MHKHKISFIGDVMLNKDEVKYDIAKMTSIFKYVKGYFDSSDYLVLNLETPLSKNRSMLTKERYSFCSPEYLVDSIKTLGSKQVYLTANNHCLDRGIDVLHETSDILEEKYVLHIGTNGFDKLFLQCGKLKISIINFTYGTNAFNNKQYLNSEEENQVCLLQNQEKENFLVKTLERKNNFFIKCIRKTFKIFHIFQLNLPIYERENFSFKKRKHLLNLVDFCLNKSDLLVSCLHIGGQYNPKPTKYNKKITRLLNKHGSKVVINNHEHRIQNSYFDKNVAVFYSLGNFIGINGVTIDPFDTFSRFSLCVHLYIDDESRDISLFNEIFVSFEDDDGVVRVSPYHIFLKECKYENKKEIIAEFEKMCDFLKINKSYAQKGEFFVCEIKI